MIEDDTELSGTDIKNPKAATDQNSQPVVTMEFTDKGREAFARVTKRIAERGSKIIPPSGTPREQTFQRFAITLDNQIVSLATIDYVSNPEGIDGRTGAQIENIGSFQETNDLAESLRIGALPIELKLISNTQVSATLGQQALDQGLLAGAAGLALTILFLLALLPRAGARGHRGAPHLRGHAVRARQADPDHADAAGHRREWCSRWRWPPTRTSSCTSASRKRCARAGRSRPRSPPATRRRYARSSTPTS